MKRFDTSRVKQGGPMRHDQMDPVVEYIYRQVWAIVGPYQTCNSWEAFEAVCCRNEDPESEIPFFAYVCGRFEDFKKKNPSADNFKLKRAYIEINRDYFNAHPYVCIVGDDGTSEIQIMEGYKKPSQQMVADVAAIGADWLKGLEL